MGNGIRGRREAGKTTNGEEEEREKARSEARERLIEGLEIVGERPAREVTDGEVDAAVWAWEDWKAPDTHRLQIGFVRRAWPVIAPWVRHIFKASLRLGLYPDRLKASNAIPTFKHAKKDKTSPKSYRPVEQHAEALAKPLERLMADRLVYEAESLGLLREEQFDGLQGRSTQQAADVFIHKVQAQMDEGKIFSTLFFDLKGAFNGISHRVVIEELAALGFSRSTIAVRFGDYTIRSSERVKWVGIILDRKLMGREYIAARAASAARALNASISVMHSSWGMRPTLIRDLVRSTVLPCADYGVSSFLPFSPATFKPLDKIDKSVARCITGSFCTVSLAALEKEAAILPAQLRIEWETLHTIAYCSNPTKC
ncbi:reverse transcriptase [Mycena venus]|uniref:Reverse transcriptase n=1 Tax=Mycena venus TaxID=2733690 RepID=A0A8H7DHZ3_9AGAR|nr:reverse transcriptase [Mycena venus]